MTTVNLEQGGYTIPMGVQLGSVEGKQKGSERMFLSSTHILGPRVVWNGIVALNNTSGQYVTYVKIPRLVPYNENLANYVVQVTPILGLVAIGSQLNTGGTAGGSGCSVFTSTASLTVASMPTVLTGAVVNGGSANTVAVGVIPQIYTQANGYSLTVAGTSTT